MEIIWYGGSCIRLKGREGTVAADPFKEIVGPTGRGMTADIVTYGRPDESIPKAKGKAGRAGEDEGQTSRQLGVPLPTSLENAFALDAPGEYEVHGVMVTGVRTFRDPVRGQERGAGTSFVYELDGLFTAHLGDVGHLLSQETLGEMGHIDIACLAIGPSLNASHAAELVAQLDANLVVPMPTAPDAGVADEDMQRFLREMSVTDPQPVPKLNVSISTIPNETTVVVLEPRGRT
jgi:L-ascorbate metabolism protein UlaG (beta-lactamase superfamily)